ncbi:MAG: hypothetical protein AB7G37_18410 [Solirubrobacteraceae bacterium]
MRFLRPVPPLALCSAVALVGCGDGGRLDASTADALRTELTRIEQAVDQGRCDDATRTIELGRNRVDQLPATVDDGVIDSLEQGFRLLAERVQADCAGAVTTETTTTETIPTETTTETTPPEPTTTTDTTPTTTPTFTDPDLPPDDDGDLGDDDGDDGSGGLDPETGGDALRGDGTSSGLRSRGRPDDDAVKRGRGRGPGPDHGRSRNRGDR